MCQDSYLANVYNTFRLDGKYGNCHVPIPTEPLEPYEGQADIIDKFNYQRKVSKIGYPAKNTRPNVATAYLKLARFLTNPGLKHHEVAEQCLAYLYKTRFLALKLRSDTI